MQKSLALRNLLIEALACLYPDKETGIKGIQKNKGCREQSSMCEVRRVDSFDI